MSSGENIKISSILSEKAMIARLSTGGWSGRVTDKAVTEELTTLKRAKTGTTSVTKAIIDKKHFKRIRDAVSSMKRYHNEQTMPWDNNGGRLLPSTQLQAYTMQLRECKRELAAATIEFVAAYTTYINEAEESLGDLFNRSDYPSVLDIETKFMIDTAFEKVPESDDFRVDIPDHEQVRIRQQIESRVENQHAQAMKRIWLRIFKAIEHLHERLSEENSIFRDSLVGNIQQLVDVLPTLNILNDNALAEMTRELKDKFCQYTPEDLRRNVVLRREVIENSQELMNKMSQMEIMSDEAETEAAPLAAE